MTQLYLTCLGAPQVHYGDQPLTFATRKTLALLIYLAVEGGTHRREKIMALLWPDRDEKRARGALRITLTYLRRALATAVSPETYLHITSHNLAFNFDSEFTLDTQLLHYSLTNALSPAPAPLRPSALFLDGFSLPDAPAYEEWITSQRAYLHQQISQQFDQLSQQQANAHQFDDSFNTTSHWLTHDPLNEAGHRRLMQLHTLIGNRTAALQAYRHCQTLLQTELGIEPATETQALYEQIKAGEQGQVGAEEISPTLPRPSADLLPFVGRTAEYAQLTTIFYRLSQQTQTAALLGEPGIGKTRLAQEFLNWAALQGADVLSGRAFEAGGRLPYQPLVAALRPRLEAENAPEDLLSDVWLAELSRLLPELRDRYPDLPPANADDSLARTRLLEAIAQLGAALTDLAGPGKLIRSRPVTFFIDDLQWADAATLDALLYCATAWAANQRPILLLLAIRSDHLAADPSLTTWLANLSGALPVRRLSLEAITAADTAQLVAEWQRGSREVSSSLLPSSPSLGDWLYRETAGQPFFMSETLKMLQEETAVPPRTLAPTVRQLILTRLNRLSAGAKALLTAVAIIGRPTHFQQLCQILAAAEEEMLPALDELLQRQLLLETAGQHATRQHPHHPYTFSHDKIRDVVYTEAGDARRRLYHRRALVALEQANAPAAELAHHALAAHLDDAAFRHSLTAGDAAMPIFAITDAIHHYEQARAVISEQLSIISKQSLYVNLSRAYELVGNFDKAKGTAEEMLALAQQVQDAEMICAALNRLATLAIYTHQLETAAAYLQQIITTATNSHSPWLAEAEWGLAQLAQHRYDMQAAKIHSQRALQLAQLLDAPELIARSHNSLGYAHLLLGDFPAAIATLSEARQRYLALGNRALEADSLTGIAGAMIFQGRAAAAVVVLQEALNIYQAIDNPWGILFSSGWLAAGLLDVGRFSEALNVCLPIAEHAQTLGATPVSIWHHLWTGNAHRALLQLDKAIAAHQQAARLNQPHPLRPFAEYIAAELCADYALLGDWPQAAAQAQVALQHRNYQALPQIVLPRWATTAALLRAGYHQQAHDDLQQSENLWGQLPRFRVALLRAQAILSEWAGNTPQAMTQLEEARTLANEIGLPGEQSQNVAKLTEL